MAYEVEIIARSCGVRNPRGHRHFHARVVQPNGIAAALIELYPEVSPAPATNVGGRIRNKSGEFLILSRDCDLFLGCVRLDQAP